MKPLDFVRTPQNNFAIVTEISYSEDNKTRCSIEFIGDKNPKIEYNAWWDKDDLTVIDNLPSLITRCFAHPFSNRPKLRLNFIPKNMEG